MARASDTQAKGEAPTFTKDQLVQSKKYVQRRDALNALLDGGKSYSFDEADNILKQFYEGGKA